MSNDAPGTGGHDPYANFNFRVRYEGRMVAGVSHVLMLEHGVRGSKRATGANAVELERGMTYDPPFAAWIARGDHRADLTVDLLNEAGETVTSYALNRCRVVERQRVFGPPAGADVVAFEKLIIETESWRVAHSV